MILRLSLDLPDDITYIRTTRLLVRCLLQDIRVNGEIIDEVETIVAELCSNVVLHACSKASHFVLTLECYKPRLVITVTDTGLGFLTRDVLLPGTSRPDNAGGMRYGGFGLSLLNALSDRIDFATTFPHGTTVRVEKKLSYETPADSDRAGFRDTIGGRAVAMLGIA